MDSKTETVSEYPEHKKFDRGVEFQALSNFIGFLEENGYELTKSTKGKFEIDIQPRKALYHYFGVNEKALELERKKMLFNSQSPATIK